MISKDEFQYALNETEPCWTDPDPEKWTGAWVNNTTYGVAQELCSGCHMLDNGMCLQYALDNDETDFIFGGTTPQYREGILNGTYRRELETPDPEVTED